jgi:hypothetical protein
MARRKYDSPWKGWAGVSRSLPWVNPRPPAVPANLELSLEGYFTAAVAIGFLSAQAEEPDRKKTVPYLADWGEDMAAEERRRRRARFRRSRRSVKRNTRTT